MTSRVDSRSIQLAWLLVLKEASLTFADATPAICSSIYLKTSILPRSDRGTTRGAKCSDWQWTRATLHAVTEWRRCLSLGNPLPVYCPHAQSCTCLVLHSALRKIGLDEDGLPSRAFHADPGFAQGVAGSVVAEVLGTGPSEVQHSVSAGGGGSAARRFGHGWDGSGGGGGFFWGGGAGLLAAPLGGAALGGGFAAGLSRDDEGFGIPAASSSIASVAANVNAPEAALSPQPSDARVAALPPQPSPMYSDSFSI